MKPPYTHKRLGHRGGCPCCKEDTKFMRKTNGRKAGNASARGQARRDIKKELEG